MDALSSLEKWHIKCQQIAFGEDGMNKFVRFWSVWGVALFLTACHKGLPPTQTEDQTTSLQKESPIATDALLSSNSTPISTSHYSLVLPEDWVVLYGPVKERGTTRFQLIDKSKTTTVSITVGPSQAGDAEEMARRIATRLQTKAENKNGQWQCSFMHDKTAGYTIIREDPSNALLLVLTASGDIHKADFIFQMRSPYTSLIPKKL